MIEEALLHGRTVVVPSDGLGTSLAYLPGRAPELHAFMTSQLAELEADYPE